MYEEEIVRNGEVREEWVELIEKFPNKFLLGSDKIGKFVDVAPPKTNYKQEIRKYDPLLKSLRQGTAVKVASQNLRNVLPPGARKNH